MLNSKTNTIEQQFLRLKLTNQQIINQLPPKEALAAKAMQDHLNWYAREIAADVVMLSQLEQSLSIELGALKKANKASSLWQQLNARFHALCHKFSATLLLITKQS